MGCGPPLKGKRMKFSEEVANILAKRHRKSAAAIFTKHGLILEEAEKTHQFRVRDLEVVVEEKSTIIRSLERQLEEALAKIPHESCGIAAEKAVMPESEPTHFSQPTKFSSESARTGYVSCLQSNLAEHRKDMARLWEERGEVERSFQQRIDHESQQIDLLEARIHLTYSTPVEGGKSIPGPIHCATPSLKGGY